MQTLDGYVAVVGDASSAEGQATALRLAAAGSKVVLVSRSVSTLRDLAGRISGQSSQALVVPANACEYGQMQRVVATAIRSFGRVDVLVNNMDRAVSKPILASSPSEISEQIDANLKAACYACRAVLKHMVERRRGHIVNMGWMGSPCSDQGHAVYEAAKLAIMAFSRAIHREVRRHGVRVTYLGARVPAATLGGTCDASPPWPACRRPLPDELADSILRCVESGP